MTWIAALIFLGIIVLAILFLVGIYNRLVAFRNQYKNAFSQIDVQLKRRYDLIPNLVETAKGYMKHERETLEAVIAARNQAVNASQAAASSPGDPSAMQGLAGAETALTGAVGRLFALMESYPDLKANQNMLKIQEELTSTENKVAFARQAYNDAVTLYNTSRETFPSVLIASPVSLVSVSVASVSKCASSFWKGTVGSAPIPVATLGRTSRCITFASAAGAVATRPGTSPSSVIFTII